MKNNDNNNEDFIKALEEISERVEKMPEWKKRGWAILDERSTYCGSVDKKSNSLKSSSDSSKTVYT